MAPAKHCFRGRFRPPPRRRGAHGQHSTLPIQRLGAGAVRGRKLTLLGKWAIVLDNYFLLIIMELALNVWVSVSRLLFIAFFCCSSKGQYQWQEQETRHADMRFSFS